MFQESKEGQTHFIGDSCRPPHTEVPMLETTRTWDMNAVELSSLSFRICEWAERHAREISYAAYEELKEILK